MNEFIELRKSIADYKNPYVFPLLLLDKYLENSKTIGLDEAMLIKRIKRIQTIDLNTISINHIYELFLILGDDKYLDRYIVDRLLNLSKDDSMDLLKSVIKDIISNRKYKGQNLYHLLEICIECDMHILSNRDVFFILEEYRMDLDVISVLIDYLDRFKLEGLEEKIYELLKEAYPDNLKIHLLTYIIDNYGKDQLDTFLLKYKIRNKNNKLFYDNYMDFLRGEFIFEKEGLLMVQTMFYGDFEDSGKGNNGGLAVLLKSLGGEISKDKRVSFVVTISLAESLDKPFLSFYKDKHIFVRLPIYINRSETDLFIKRELSIKRYISKFLKRAHIDPDVFHIKYLDNASKAMASLNEEMHKTLVFTLAPDPHRNMFDEDGNLRDFSFKELIEKLNKIKIGDELIYKSQGIIGIGNKDVREELEIYFPQFREESIKKKIRMISEGIKTHIVYEENVNLSQFASENEIDPGFFQKPTILNVGRLSIQKGQIELLKAWMDSEFFKTHNLLIIGGDKEKPSPVEKTVIDFFQKTLEENPEIKNRFFHKAAIANESIRLLERSIIKKEFDLPHIYICSSIKEEFGIAILEAMSQGFLVMGPIKGGVKTYIENGVNGFLIDTSSSKTIIRELRKYLYDLKINKDKFIEIQNAGKKTVEENFSMKNISSEFLDFYLSLKEEPR